MPGSVQDVQRSQEGWSFNIWDDNGQLAPLVAFRTEAEAIHAHAQMKAMTASAAAVRRLGAK